MATTRIGTFGNDTITGAVSGDTLIGFSGDDVYDLGVLTSGSFFIVEDAGGGRDAVKVAFTFTLPDNVEDLFLTTLTGVSPNNNFNGIGNALDNHIVGNIGNNQLDGGTGKDTLEGGLGDDTFVVDNLGDKTIENAGEGTDRVTASVTWTLGANIENLTLSGGLAINGTGNELDNVIAGNGAANIINALLGNDTVTAGSGNDTVDGGAGNDSLSGQAGDDRLLGGLGNDTLDGGAGHNQLIGGLGDDRYVVLNVNGGTDTIVETANGGNDTVSTDRSVFTLPNFVENLITTLTTGATLVGNALDNSITGASGADNLFGGAGNDLLDGKGGGDTMTGGTGDDFYLVEQSGDLVVEQANGGNDQVFVNVNDAGAGFLYIATAEVERITLAQGSLTTKVRGNASDNIITGNAADNTLEGQGGNDRLDGGAGNDTLTGGTGNDTYLLDTVGDVVIESAGAGTGTDLVLFAGSGNYTLVANVENGTLTGTGTSLTGNTLGNVLTGNERGNLLDGGTGADTLVGGLGNDTYVVDNLNDRVTEGLGGGIDLVRSSAGGGPYILGANIENLELLAAAGAVNGTGNALDNSMTGNGSNNLLDGGAGSDLLIGGAGNDTLLGGAGNDSMDGGTGDDSMRGGAGNDTYTVDSASDIVVELAGQGTDELDTSIAIDLTLNAGLAGIDYVVLANVAGTPTNVDPPVNLKGNALDNILVGNNQRNEIQGGAGNDLLWSDAPGSADALADTLIGGVGNDRYVVSNDADVVTELANQGTDVVFSRTANFTLPANVEHLEMQFAAGPSTGTGNELANVIAGSSFDNVIDGLAGNDRLLGLGGNDSLTGGTGTDTLEGGIGNDTYKIDSLADVVIEAANSGTDLVQLDVNFAANTLYDLTAKHLVAVENVTVLGDNGLRINGNLLANVINGSNVGNDVLDGKAGNDRLFGNGGNDTLIGGGGNDLLDGGAGNDSMSGGAGNDTYRIDSGTDVVVEAANGGIDTVVLQMTGPTVPPPFVLGANLENLAIDVSNSSPVAFDVTANNLANVIDIDADAIAGSVLNALDGNDVVTVAKLIGTLNGGLGTDTLDATVLVGTAAGTVTSFEAITLRGSGAGDAIFTGAIDAPTTLTVTGASNFSVTGLVYSTDTLVQLNNYGPALTSISVVPPAATLTLGLTGATAGDTLHVALNGTDAALVDAHLLGAVGNLDVRSLTGVNAIDVAGMADLNALTGLSITGNANVVVNGLGGNGLGTVASTETLGVDLSSISAGALGLNIATALSGGNDALTLHLDGVFIDDLRIGLGAEADTLTLLADAGAQLSRVTLSGLAAPSTTNINGAGDIDVRGIDSTIINIAHTGKVAATFDAGATVDVSGASDVTLTGSATLADTVSMHNTLNNIDRIDLGAGSGDVLNADVDGLDGATTGRLSITNTEIINLTLSTGSASVDGFSMSAGTKLILGASSGSLTVTNALGTYDATGFSGHLVLSGVAQSFFGNVIVTAGSAQDDTLTGSGSSTGDAISGGAGNDTISGLAGNDALNGNTGDDSIDGGAGDDTIDAGDGNDSVTGGDGNDTIAGGIGNDTLSGALGNDSLTGGVGDDSISGGDGNDTMLGGDGNDSIDGGNGNDRIDGGLGSDTVTGGAGLDLFVFAAAPNGTDIDTVTDFSSVDDLVLLDKSVLASLAAVPTGALGTDRFFTDTTFVDVNTAGDATTGANDFIKYESSTGKLYYDADGNGAGAAVQIAVFGVGTHPALTAEDFTVT